MRSFILAAVLLLFPLDAFAQDVQRWQTKNNYFQTMAGEKVTPRGVSLCSLEWHKPLEQIKSVTTPPDNWNINILRLPVQVREWDRVGADSYIKDYLDPAVKLCREKKLQCIIDWHEVGRWDDAENIKKLDDFWAQVAPRYAADRNIIYEIFNEPTEPKSKSAENWAAWKSFIQKRVDMVRMKAPNTLLLIGSPHWSQMPSFAAEDPVTGKNIAYVMHLYPNYKPGSWDKAFGNAAEKVPVILTEWGWSAAEKHKGNYANPVYGTEEDFGKPLKEYLDARPHIGWTAWSYDEKCGPAMLGPDKDMGAFVKSWLEEANGP